MSHRTQSPTDYFDRLLILLEYAFEFFSDVHWEFDNSSSDHSDHHHFPDPFPPEKKVF